jgi:phosphatidylethanolamine/phosphatidyl-N-methylethanolamine N-methyltransferase
VAKTTDKFYNQFFRFYPLVDFFLKPQKKKLYKEINGLLPGKLLEIGVGNGADLFLYQSHEITAVDSSSKMLEIARARAIQGVELLEMNAQFLKFSNDSFDYVVLSHVIAVVEDPQQLLEEIYRVLKPGGKLLILNHFTPGNWLKYIDQSFQVIAKQFHFRSVFRLNSFSAINKFRLIQETGFGRLSYFKLLIYCKS